MTERSLRPDVRNPVLALPGLQAVLALSPETRGALCVLLVSIRDEARAKAQKSWKQNKAPMAAYWKVVGVYVEHIRRAIRPLKGEVGGELPRAAKVYGTVEVRCEACDAPFMAKKADRARGWGRFCTKRCKARKQNRTGGGYPGHFVEGEHQ